MCLVVALGISFILDVIAIFPRQYAGASVSLYDHPEYAGFRPQKLVKQLIGDTEVAITKNKSINKLRLWLYATSLVVTTVVSVILFIMLYLKQI